MKKGSFSKADKDKYINKHKKAAIQYSKDVESGKVVACKKIIAAVKRQKDIESKYFINEEALDKIFGFLYYVNLSKAGKIIKFNPAPYQSWIFYNLFGYYKDKKLTRRLFKNAIIFISRKAGKTTIGAILAIYAVLKEDRSNEAYTLSLTKEQAAQSLRYAKQIVKDSPVIAKYIRIMQYQLIADKNGSSIFKALPAIADTLLGLSPGFIIADEVSVFPDKEALNALTTGTLAHPNAMTVFITTASFYKDFPFYNDEYTIGGKVLNGEIELDNTFYAFFELDEGDDIDDTSLWPKANPSINVTMDLEDLVGIYSKAKLSYTDLAEFRVKNLNIWMDNATSWIPDSDYRKCFIDSDMESLKGEKAYLGIDMSATRDLAALSIVIENPSNGKVETKTEFYFPTSDNEANKIRKSGIDLGGWIDKGFIIEHKNKIIDYDMVFDRIKYYVDNYDVQGLSFDPWSMQILNSQLESRLFIDLYAARQTSSYYNYPMKFIERLVYSENINLSKNPVLRWCFRNVIIYADSNGNIKPMKNKGNDSIDGLTALAMAIGLYAKLNYDSVSMIMDSYNGRPVELNKQ